MARQPAFTPAEIDAIERVLGDFPLRDLALFRLMTATGLRIAEALKLRIADVCRQGAIRPDLVVTRALLKGGVGKARAALKSRTLPLGDSVRPVLEELVFALAGSSPDAETLNRPLFRGRAGRPLSRRHATHQLRRLLLAAGLADRAGYGWHCARRTFAGEICEVTAHDINLTREVMGHAHLETTMIYLPQNDRAAREAVLAVSRRQAHPASYAATPGDGRKPACSP